MVDAIVMALLGGPLGANPGRGSPANHRDGGGGSTTLLTPLQGLFIVAVDGDGSITTGDTSVSAGRLPP
jgi:hypothetical protein